MYNLYGYLINAEIVCRHCSTDDDIINGAQEILLTAEHDLVCTRCESILHPTEVPCDIPSDAVLGYQCECCDPRYHPVLLTSSQRRQLHTQFGDSCYILAPGCVADQYLDNYRVIFSTPTYQIQVDTGSPLFYENGGHQVGFLGDEDLDILEDDLSDDVVLWDDGP